MGRKSILNDPEIMHLIIADMIKGHPQHLIAGKYGVRQPTVSNWKKNKKFNQLYSAEIIKRHDPCLDQLMIDDPKTYLERHPEYRETWGKPVENAPKIALGFQFRITYVNREARGLPEPEAVEVESQDQGKLENKGDST